VPAAVPNLVTQEDVLDGYIRLLHAAGADALPTSALAAALAEEWRRICDPASGFLYFWRWYGWMYLKKKNGGWKRACPDGEPKVEDNGRTWEWQFAVCRQLCVEREILLILKARQLGWSHLRSNFVIWWAITKPEQRIACVANKMQTSETNQRRAKAVYQRLPAWIREKVPLTNPAVSHTEFGNGSIITPYSGDPDALRTEGAGLLDVDEIGQIEQLDAFFAAARSVAAEGGTIVMAGTAKDNGVEAWVRESAAGRIIDEIVVDGLDGSPHTITVHEGENDMDFMFLPYFIVPTRDSEWMEKEKRLFRGNLAALMREHPGTWQEAFTAVGSGFFDSIALGRAVHAALDLFESRDRRGRLEMPGGPATARFIPDPFGNVVIHATEKEFEEILATKRPWAIFADCAGENKSGDFHAACAVQVGRVPDTVHEQGAVDPHRQVITIHGYMDSDEFAFQLAALGYLLGRALLAVEVNGVGTAVIMELRRLRYPNLYRRRTSTTTKGDKATSEIGWFTTGGRTGNKPVMYGELERLLRNQWIEIRDAETLLEMAEVTQHGHNGTTIGAPEPKHDDRADALAGCSVILPYARHYRPHEAHTDERAPFYAMEAVLARDKARRKPARIDEMGAYV
jgi:hypothetical protein